MITVDHDKESSAGFVAGLLYFLGAYGEYLPLVVGLPKLHWPERVREVRLYVPMGILWLAEMTGLLLLACLVALAIGRLIARLLYVTAR
jgi:hypothetical protein